MNPIKKFFKNIFESIWLLFAFLWIMTGLSNFPFKDGGLVGGLLNLAIFIICIAAVAVLLVAAAIGAGIYLWVK
jgi:hypothetical protein